MRTLIEINVDLIAAQAHVNAMAATNVNGKNNQEIARIMASADEAIVRYRRLQRERDAVIAHKVDNPETIVWEPFPLVEGDWVTVKPMKVHRLHQDYALIKPSDMTGYSDCLYVMQRDLVKHRE